MTKHQAQIDQARWAAVAAMQAAEQRAATPARRFQQLNAVWRLARGLGLPPPARDVATVRAHWLQLKRAYNGQRNHDSIPFTLEEPPTIVEADMRPPDELAALVAPLAAAQKLLDHFGNQGVIIGGVAASIIGKPRMTADVDLTLLLSLADLPDLLRAAAQEGLLPRIADAEEFARQSLTVLLYHPASGVNLDIVLGFTPFEQEMVARSQLVDLGPIAVRLPTPEDLIIMKAYAHRPQDLLDIQGIITAQPTLDHARIRYWVDQFAEATDKPELWTDIAPWLK